MDNDFENKIKQTIDNHPKYPINHEMFDAITKQLDESHDVRGFRTWIIPFVTGLLLSGIGVYLWTNPSKDGFQTNEQHLNHVVVDTNYSHRNIVIYDTIYKQITVLNGTSNKTNTSGQYSLSSDNKESSVNNSKSLAFYRAFYRKYNSSTSFREPYKSNKFIPFNSMRDNVNHTASMINRTRTDIKRVAFDPIDRLNLLDIKGLDLERKRVRIVHNQFWERLLRKDNLSGITGLLTSISTFLNPKYYAVNIDGGYVLPLNLKNPKENFQFNFDIELGFDDNWSFITGLSSLSYGFEKEYDAIDINTLTDFPIIEDAHPGDVLDRISGEFKIIQIPIGIKFKLGQKYRLTPTFSGGLMCQIPTKTNLDYYFTGNFAYERKQDKVLKYKGLFTDYWTSVGLLYHYNSKFGLELSTSYQGSLNKGKYDFENNQLVNFSVGIQYKL